MKWIDFIRSLFADSRQVSTDSKEEASGDLERAWLHAKDAYQNVQSTIQFVDTKTSVLVGIITIVTAGVASLPFAILALDLEKKKAILTHLDSEPCLKTLLGIFWAFTLVTGIAALICALLSTIARLPNYIQPLLNSTQTEKKLAESSATILFPLTRRKDLEEVRRSLGRLHLGLEHRQILCEYERQLLITGAILHSKVQFNRRAVVLLISHIVLASILVLLVAYAFL